MTLLILLVLASHEVPAFDETVYDKQLQACAEACDDGAVEVD